MTGGVAMGIGGGGGNGGGKRQATTPVGGIYKDSRRNIRGDEDYEDEEDQYTQVIRNKPKDPPKQSEEQPTYAGAASGAIRKNANPQNLGAGIDQPAKVRPKKFLTPAPEGSMRGDIVIEVQTVNGNNF